MTIIFVEISENQFPHFRVSRAGPLIFRVYKNRTNVNRENLDQTVKERIQECQRLLINFRFGLTGQTTHKFKYQQKEMNVPIFDLLFRKKNPNLKYKWFTYILKI